MMQLILCILFLHGAFALPLTLQEVLKSLEEVQQLYETVDAQNRELERRLEECEQTAAAADTVKPERFNNPVAFTATGTIDRTYANGNVFVFEQIDVNIGAGYSPATNEFTAGDSGLYLFTVSVISKNRSNCFFELVRDGTSLVKSMADEAGNFASSTITMMVKLNAGQKVWVRAYESRGCNLSTQYGRPHFSGTLMYLQ